ncbi:hypothetical protein CF326_g8906 [Tilletia indica]|nr:hypothetical protein CF326_g8906 [Tilletia indica]
MATSSTAEAPPWPEIDKNLGFTTRKWQRRLIELIQSGKDVLLIAPTGSGKGVLIKILMVALPDLQWVILQALKSLEMEFAERSVVESTVAECPVPNALTIADPDPSAFTDLAMIRFTSMMNEDHRDKSLFQRFERGEVKTVLLSPEMALSNTFMSLFESPAFRKRPGGIILDEAHVVYDWGTKTGFREKVKQLSHLRHQVRISPRLTHSSYADSICLSSSLYSKTAAVGLAMSGTLPTTYRNDVQRVFELRDHAVMDLGTNRPNLCYRVSVMQHPQNTFLDLLAYLPELWPFQEGKEKIQAVPTIIYVNDKNLGQRMWGALRGWYEAAGFKNAITTFSAEASEPHKQAVRPLVQSRDLLCVCATDALGMGSDISAVRRVIQWGWDDSETAVLQRKGRAGRRATDAAEAIMIVEPWILGDGARDVSRRKGTENQAFLSVIIDAVKKKGCIRQAFNALMKQPKKPVYSQSEIVGISEDAFDAEICAGS